MDEEYNYEQEAIEEDEEQEGPVPEKYSISSYGADYVVDMLVKRIVSKDIYIPHFQREFIWTITQSSRFIESLLLGLPVPGIFLSRDDDSKKLLVIDGQQRLRSLHFFYEGIFANKGKEFRLTGVQKSFEGKTYKSLADEERRQLDDSIIHATIIKQDEPSNDNSSIYYIFQRLNTFGTPLTHQEIRATINLGEFNDLLEKLNTNDHWRNLYGNINKRRRDQEFILRFFALYYNIENYSPPMKKFLDDFMDKNRHLKKYSETELTELFNKIVEIIDVEIGPRAFRPIRGFNVATYDAIMIGIAQVLFKQKLTPSNLSDKYDFLLRDPKFKEAIKTGTTAQEDSVKKRIGESAKIFGSEI